MLFCRCVSHACSVEICSRVSVKSLERSRAESQTEAEIHGLVPPGVGDGFAGGQLEGGDGRKHDEPSRERYAGQRITRKGCLADGRELAVGDELNGLKAASDGRGACCHPAAIFTNAEGRILIDLKVVCHIWVKRVSKWITGGCVVGAAV